MKEAFSIFIKQTAIAVRSSCLSLLSTVSVLMECLIKTHSGLMGWEDCSQVKARLPRLQICSDSGTHMVERQNRLWKLSSDLHSTNVTCAHKGAFGILQLLQRGGSVRKYHWLKVKCLWHISVIHSKPRTQKLTIIFDETPFSIFCKLN